MKKACAADWLVSLDMSGVKRHLEEARRQDEQPAAPTFRVVGACRHTGRMKLVREGMTQAEAETLRRKMAADPLCVGFALFIQRDDQELPW